MLKIKTEIVRRTQLQVGDVAHFHGARFRIADVRPAFCMDGPSPVAVALGKWIDGNEEDGYFGPDRDWTFQGNTLATVAIEPRRAAHSRLFAR